MATPKTSENPLGRGAARVAAEPRCGESLALHQAERIQELERALEQESARRERLEELLRESEERLRTVFESANDEIVYTHLDGTVIDVNHKVEDIFGYKPEEVIGKNYAEMDFLSPEDLAVSAQVVNDIVSGRPGRILEFEVRHRNGKRVFIEINAKLVRKNGEIKGFLSIIRDITDRKQAEETLRRYKDHLEELVDGRTVELRQEIQERKRVEDKLSRLNEELERRVGERTAELEEAYEGLKKLDEMKDSFLSSVSHELRTPLTSIRSFAEILMQYADENPETRREFLEIIHLESERLSRLIDDVLDLSKIEAGEMAYNDAHFSLEEVIEDVLRSQRQVIRANELHCRVAVSTTPCLVFADRDRIQQVMTNLLGNAVKFSRQGGTLRIGVEALVGRRSEENPRWLRVSVADDGIGIEPKDLEIIFDKFRQASHDTLGDKPRGTGLGLPICKEIVSHYGGNLWARSEPGKGSIFFFTLPAAGPSALGGLKGSGDSTPGRA